MPNHRRTSQQSTPIPAPLRSARDRAWPMVGRDPELSEAIAAWARVREGGRELLLIAGEPGAGKSRLASEIASVAHADGGIVLYGSADLAAEAPYGPLVEALGHLAQQASPPVATALGRSALGTLGAGGNDGESVWHLGNDRARLFSAALELLEDLSELGPVLLVIDDLHSCGSATLALIHHLASAAEQAPFLLLATYRPTDIKPDGEAAETLSRLRSNPACRHLQLAGLDQAAIREIAGVISPSASSATLDRAAVSVARESGGNPLFACELLQELKSGAERRSPEWPAPSSLRVLIAARTRSLGGEAGQHLSAAAVVGNEFAIPLLAEALELAESDLEHSVELAERAGLLMPIAPGRYRFSHSVVARCLYEELSLSDRGRLHRRIAERLDRGPETGAESVTAQLAHHWRLAEPPDRARAATACAEAAESALRGYDHELAADWFEQALELHGPAQDDQRCALLLGSGVALRPTNQERSRELLLEAARLADRLGDDDRLIAAALANHRGFVSHVGAFDRERGAMLRRAGDRAPDSSPVSALIMAQLALELTFSGQVERRRRLARDALKVARDHGDRQILSQVLIRCLIADWGPDNPDERIAAAAESIQIGAELDEPLDLFHALHWQAVAQLELGQVSAASRTLREQEVIAQRVGDSTALWLCDCTNSMHLALHGRLEEAENRARRAVEGARHSAQPDALPFYVSQLASIRWQQGRLAEMAPLLALALEQYPGIPAFRSLVVLAHSLSGDTAFAKEVLAADSATAFAEIPRDPIWIAALTTYAHAVAEIGDRAASAQLRELLDPYRGRLATTTVSIWGLVDHALGRLELLQGEVDAGHSSLRTSISAYTALRAPLWRAQAEQDLAAGGPDDRRLEARLATLGLTPRQAEVTLLVARGLSNQAVAAELQVSASTVKRHLENSYRRTGVGSRSALTALLLD